MKMAGNCDATNGAGLSNAPTPGWDSFADCSSVMNICSPPTGLSSISPASGSRCGNVYETRSKKKASSAGYLKYARLDLSAIGLKALEKITRAREIQGNLRAADDLAYSLPGDY